MNTGVDNTFSDFSMQVWDLQVEGLFDFPILSVVKHLADLQDESSAVGHTAYGLRTNLLGFLEHFNHLLGHWHD
jgi:hypothetical protein